MRYWMHPYECRLGSNTRAIAFRCHYDDCVAIRRAATQNNITMLNFARYGEGAVGCLEEVTIGVSTIDERMTGNSYWC